MIELKNVSKKYPKNDFYSCKDITLNINKNEVLGFMGTNGAGKTTLIKMICDLVKRSSGEIYIDGQLNSSKIAQESIGVLLEGARNVYNFLSVEDNLKYFQALNNIKDEENKEKIDNLLKIFQLEDKKNVTVNQLSRGMQQKVAIMIAILKDPDYLILDEPTLGLDIESKHKMKNFLSDLSKKYNKGIVVCSHDADVIEDVCDRVAIFKKGELLEVVETSSLKNKEDLYRITLENYNGLEKDLEIIEKTILSNEGGLLVIETKKGKEIFSKVHIDKIIELEKISKSIEEIYLDTVLGGKK